MDKINYDRLGRITAALNYENALALHKQYTPVLKDLKHLPKIYSLICNTFPDYGQFDRNVLIAACIYQLYSPASLLKGRCSKAPAGMRKVVAELLGYDNATNINYWQDKAKAFVKGRRYVGKMKIIIQHFETYPP